MTRLELLVQGREGGTIRAEVRDLVIAGWTGRDAAGVEHHIAELEAIGVARPRTVPCFYRVGTSLLTTANEFDVTGGDSSGEVEYVLLSLPEGMYVGVGSDHTDRKVEAYGVTVSKQMCAKPIGGEVWAFDDVREHWDELVLRSWVTRDGVRTLYQEGAVTRMLAPLELIARYNAERSTLPVGTAMYCGTMPLLAAMGAADLFEMEIEDPVRGRKLEHRYQTRTLAYQD